jgi:DNA-binding transcriptional regulator YdaS (Cro superfamily)
MMPEVAERYASPADALRAGVEIIGGQAATARLLGCSQPTVWRWLAKEKSLPAEHVLTFERATGIPRDQIRPDIYLGEQAGSVEPNLFDRFGGIQATAEAANETVATVLRWYQDRRIPSDRQPLILRRAAELKLGITAEDVIFPFPEDRNA